MEQCRPPREVQCAVCLVHVPPSKVNRPWFTVPRKVDLAQRWRRRVQHSRKMATPDTVIDFSHLRSSTE